MKKGFSILLADTSNSGNTMTVIECSINYGTWFHIGNLSLVSQSIYEITPSE